MCSTEPELVGGMARAVGRARRLSKPSIMRLTEAKESRRLQTGEQMTGESGTESGPASSDGLGRLVGRRMVERA